MGLYYAHDYITVVTCALRAMCPRSLKHTTALKAAAAQQIAAATTCHVKKSATRESRRITCIPQRIAHTVRVSLGRWSSESRLECSQVSDVAVWCGHHWLKGTLGTFCKPYSSTFQQQQHAPSPGIVAFMSLMMSNIGGRGVLPHAVC